MKTLITSLLVIAAEQSLIQSRSIKRAFCSRRRNNESQIRSAGIADSYPRRNYFCPQPPSLSLSLSLRSALVEFRQFEKFLPTKFGRACRIVNEASVPRCRAESRPRARNMHGNAETADRQRERIKYPPEEPSREETRSAQCIAEITRRRMSRWIIYNNQTSIRTQIIYINHIK
jgi:hypothetical protein